MYNPISWHIEPTSRCTLECPGCDRTWYNKTFKKQIIEDIDVDALVNFFKLNNFENSKIRLCGNNGDPIYHPQFIDLLTKLKLQKHKISLHTNGSAKTKVFWQAVCNQLDEHDSIIFAIDGLEDTNHLYRKNSNWKQIMDAIDITTKSNVQTEWQFIVFKHNQGQIQQAKDLSKKLGIDQFNMMKSHRWIDDSSHDYMPDDQFVDEKYDQQKQTVNNNIDMQMTPKCLTNKDIYIDSYGNIYPCCWSGTHRFKFKNSFGKNPLNIQQGNYQLDNDKHQFVTDSKQWNTASLVCKMHCAK